MSRLTHTQALELMTVLAPHSVDHAQHFADEIASQLVASLISIASTALPNVPGVAGELQRSAGETLTDAAADSVAHAKTCGGCK